jgi:fluoride exporter
MRPTFPYGTFLVNMLGCFLIGFFVVLAEEKFLLGPNTRIFLMIGFCGAFTTFSTFMLETAHLIRDGSAIRAFINVMGSVAIGFVAFRLGVILGEVL